jgi:hypothetical protein
MILTTQQGMFKLTMKSNTTSCIVPPFDTNLLTHMWIFVTTYQILVSSLFKYVKLAELAMVQIVNNVENERCISTLAFMKSKLCNKLISHHPIVVCMFAQQFYKLEKISYPKCIQQWKVAWPEYCYDD